MSAETVWEELVHLTIDTPQGRMGATVQMRDSGRDVLEMCVTMMGQSHTARVDESLPWFSLLRPETAIAREHFLTEVGEGARYAAFVLEGLPTQRIQPGMVVYRARAGEAANRGVVGSVETERRGAVRSTSAWVRWYGGVERWEALEELEEDRSVQP